MKIKYSKNRIFLNGALGATFAIFGALKAFEGTAGFIHYIQLILGILMVVSFFLERKYGYLNIEDGMLTKYWFGKKTIPLERINQIHSRPGNIKLVSPEKNLSINTSVIDKESIQELYIVLGNLDLEPQQNPFTGWSQAISSEE